MFVQDNSQNKFKKKIIITTEFGHNIHTGCWITTVQKYILCEACLSIQEGSVN